MKTLIALILCCLAAHTHGLEQGIFIGGNVGRSDIELDRGFDNQRDSQHAIAIGLNAGYAFENDIIVQINATSSANAPLPGPFDRYYLQHADLELGYQFSWRKLRITPIAGIAKWELNTKDRKGEFLNPTPEITSRLSGEDPLIGLSIGIAFSRFFQMNFTRKSVNADFGHYHQSQLDFLFRVGDF